MSAHIHLVVPGVLAMGAVLVTTALTGSARASWGEAGSGDGGAAAIALAAPTDVTATCSGTLAVSVNWTQSAHATGYTVQRSAGGGSWTTVGTAVSPPWTDTSLTGVLGLVLQWRIIADLQQWTATSDPSNTQTLNVIGNCL
jgi:hypothetical protein